MMTTELPDQLFSLSALDRLLARVEQKSAAFDAALDAAPDTKPCGMHPGQGRMLNREASWQAAKLVYVCTACEIDEKRQRIAKRIEAAGIPSDVRHATLANFSTVRQGVKTGENRVEPSVFFNKAHAFTRGEIRNLILAGTPGIGKGHLAAAIAIQGIGKGKSVVWAECARLFADYHRAYKTDSTEAIVKAHAGAALLVLDEVCLTDLPKDGEEILFAILDRRHKAGLPTILLGNAIAAEIKRWLGSRITDRLRSGGVALCYGEWQSMRGETGDAGEF